MSAKEKENSGKIVKLINEKFNLARTDDNDAIVINSEGQHFIVGDKDFNEAIKILFFDKYGVQPFAKDLGKAALIIKQQALAEGKVVTPVTGNFATVDDRLYFPQQDGTQMEVAAEGAKQIAALDSPALFINKNQKGFVNPDLSDRPLPAILGRYLNLASDQLLLFVCCLIKVFMPGPNPVMLFIGQQGSGKTTAAKIFRMIVDPNDTGTRVKILDNLSAIGDKLSDDLCRASHHFVQIITTISQLVPNQDLIDRTIVFDLTQISDENRIPETKLLAGLKNDMPAIMFWLYSALASALERYQEIELQSYPRLADFIQAAIAACPGLGFKGPEITSAVDKNRIDLVERSLNQNPVSAAVLDFMDSIEENSWSGTGTELLQALNEKVEEDIRQHGSWPSKPNKLSGMLNRALPFLRTRGIDILWGKSGQRSIALVKLQADSKDEPSVQTSIADFVERSSHKDPIPRNWAADEDETEELSASASEEITP